MFFIQLLLAAIQTGASLYNKNKEQQYQNDVQGDEQTQAKRTAIAKAVRTRTAQVGPMSPVKKPDLATADTIGGVAQAAQSVKWGNMGGAAADSMGGLSAGVYSAD
jgi:hypothetical protein